MSWYNMGVIGLLGFYGLSLAFILVRDAVEAQQQRHRDILARQKVVDEREQHRQEQELDLRWAQLRVQAAAAGALHVLDGLDEDSDEDCCGEAHPQKADPDAN